MKEKHITNESRMEIASESNRYYYTEKLLLIQLKSFRFSLTQTH